MIKKAIYKNGNNVEGKNDNFLCDSTENNSSTFQPFNRSTCKCFAFTLAEVLITLGIIGVVASMTIPTLIQNYKKKEAATRAKQAYSQISQAIRLSEAENGEFASWDTAMSNNAKENTKLFFDKYLAPYFKGLKLCDSKVEVCGASLSSNDVVYFFPNGTSVAFLVKPGAKMYVMIDVNGPKKPNILGRDNFYFKTDDTEQKRLMPYGWFDGITREDVLRRGYTMYGDSRTMSCKKQADEENELNRYGCTALLMLDGWEMKDDYPW